MCCCGPSTGAFPGRSFRAPTDITRVTRVYPVLVFEVMRRFGIELVYSNIVGFLLTLAFALLGALGWMLLEGNRRSESKVHDAYRIATRYVLAAGMLAYGIPKVPAMHAIQPGPIDWTIEFGAIHPDSLIWFWLAYSPMYQMSAGVVEITAGVLLFFRRTVTLGALLAMGAMLNVALLLNGFSKTWAEGLSGALTPGQFLLMALMLLAPDAKRLLLFMTDRPSPRATLPFRAWQWPRLRAAHPFIKTAVIVALILPLAWRNVGSWRDLQFKSPLHGVYTVEGFERNGRQLSLSVDEPARWLTVAIGNCAEEMLVQTVAQARHIYYLQWPPAVRPPACRRGFEMTSASEGTLVAKRELDPSTNASGPEQRLHYRRVSATELVLEGLLDSAQVSARLRRIPNGSIPLYNPAWW
jgi:hypothetical protein